jgi:two-component system LytT family sensor kinase
MATPQSRSPAEQTRTRSRVYWIALLGGLWTVFALLSAAQTAVRVSGTGPVAWSALLTDRLADWYTCALFTPAYFWLAHRFPVTGPRWRRGTVVHLAATQLFVIAKYTLYVMAGILFGQRSPAGSIAAEILHVIGRNLINENMIFWALAAAVHAVVLHQEAQEREARAERLRAELAQARLDALAGQLHPHFLFNALNSVSSLMHRDVAAADALLARLGDLLRRTLRASERPEVSLGEELTLLADYLAIVGARFRDRLTVRIDVAPGTERGLVPHFVLQPLVENALEHGIARRAGAGTIDVRASRTGADGETLVLMVADDGPGLSAGEAAARVEPDHGSAPARSTAERGIGLSNTRRRLAALHGERHQFLVCDRPGGGVEVRIEIPFRTGSADMPYPAADRLAVAPAPAFGS